MKLLASILFVLVLSSCTNVEDKHLLFYKIESEGDKGVDLYGKMGEGIEFDSPTIDFPFEVEHEVFGQNISYELAVSVTDTAQTTLEIYVDDKLIESSSTFDLTVSPPRITVVGQFQE